MKILICGSSGDVASDLIKLLLRKKYKIIAASRSIKKFSNKNIKFLKIDFSKKILINEDFDLIINCIATHEFSKKKSIVEYLDSNILSLINLLKFFKEKEVKILNLSTISIFDLTKNKILKENCDTVLNNKLSITKSIGEKILSLGNSNVINLRLPGIITHSGLSDRPWIKTIINKIKKNQNIFLFNSKKEFNSLIDTSDIVRLIDHLLNKKFVPGTYNFSADNPIKLDKLIFHIKNKLNSNSKIINSGNNKNNIIISNKLIKNKLGFKPSTVLQTLDRNLND
jgi:dTDP-4-dehydrorhamnose reductase